MANRENRIVLVGCGNMGRAIASGIARRRSEILPNLLIIEPNEDARNRIAKEFDVRVDSELRDELSDQDILILAVKPQVAAEVCAQIAPLISKEVLILSIMAGFSIAQLRSALPVCRSFVRAMPNLPAQVGEGVTVYHSVELSEEGGQKEVFLQILESIGSVVKLDSEQQIDMATAISGSGPGYLFYFVEALEEAGLSIGLPKDAAELLAKQTLIGAGELLKISNSRAKTLREQVTSKGGTTEAALESFDGKNFKSVVGEAVAAAYARARNFTG